MRVIACGAVAGIVLGCTILFVISEFFDMQLADF